MAGVACGEYNTFLLAARIRCGRGEVAGGDSGRGQYERVRRASFADLRNEFIVQLRSQMERGKHGFLESPRESTVNACVRQAAHERE